MSVCVCVCVCVKRKRQTEGKKERKQGRNEVKEFRTCYPKICGFAILIVLSQRHLKTADAKGHLISLLFLKATDETLMQRTPSHTRVKETFLSLETGN